MNTHEEQQKQFGKIIAKAWSDETFKQKLLADPTAMMSAEGIAPPPGMSFNIVENNVTVLNFVLPAKPAELDDAALERISGGYDSHWEFAWHPF